MTYEPNSLPMEDSDWRYFCEAATAEISQDIDAALMRTAANSSLADAVLLAGYLNRGHLFDKRLERCPSHELEGEPE